MRSANYRLDVAIFLGSPLFEGDELRKLETLTQEILPDWSSELCIWKESKKKRREPIKDFERDVRASALERGPLYERLAREYGLDADERRTGTVEVRGKDNSLIIVVSLDDRVFAPSSGTWLWGNSITFQLCRKRVEGKSAIEVARALAEQGCESLSPWYAHGEMLEEWNAKNMSTEDGGLMAIGVDISRYLPGLYWMNFFGEPYCSMIGTQELLSAPSYQSIEIDNGVMLYLSGDPRDWQDAEYKERETLVLEHLGTQYFFNREVRDRQTVAPDFGLRSLPRNPRFT